MSDHTTLRRTPLFDCHQESGAKFVPFGGWEMPVQYSGVIDEHRTVRSAAGLFDVSHMGELRITGPQAFDLLQYLTTNDVSKLTIGRAQYSLLLNDDGGVVDDIIIYKFSDTDYFLCVNASNTAKDDAWIRAHNRFDAEVVNCSADYAQVALQGPRAREILQKLFANDATSLTLDKFPAFHFRELTSTVSGLDSTPLLIASTGYTGEDGVEIFVPPSLAPTLWRSILEIGAPYGIKPIGLGARDTLRLEVCYPLHGHELRDDVIALCSAVGWVIKLEKGTEFIGASALRAAKAAGLAYKLAGFEVVDRGIVRDGADVFDEHGAKVGWSTSGTLTPSVNKAVGLCLIPPTLATPGTLLQADVRGRRLGIRIIKTPFYSRN